MLVILNGGKGIALSSKLIVLGLPRPAKLHTDPSGSFHTLSYSKSNPNMLVLVAPTRTSAQVNLFSPGSHKVTFAIGHLFMIP